MTAFSQAEVYRANALMNANPFALGAACVIFGLFNGIFVGGFFRTAYKLGKPFVIYTIVAFLVITAAESLHFIPGLSRLNAFGAADVPLQFAAMLGGAVIFAVMTVLSCRKACKDFERIDL